ncbi:MAG: hypothetical protein E6J02_04525 [Chloroflexi bacterium]|nr:MAG: hypothetical protein E6J02_04525 [Chloroflexota bacterium]
MSTTGTWFRSWPSGGRSTLSTTLLVRHADAGSREKWHGDDRLRPLSKRGLHQAEALVGLLAGLPLERLLSSPYLRCVQTLEPLGRSRGVKVETAEELAEGAGLEAAQGLIRRLGEVPAALCIHGDVCLDLLDELVLKRVITRDQARCQKASTWVLENGAGPKTARYLSAP